MFLQDQPIPSTLSELELGLKRCIKGNMNEWYSLTPENVWKWFTTNAKEQVQLSLGLTENQEYV